MASSTHRLGANFRDTILKAAAVRLSDAASRDTTDYAETICGDGVPSGGYGRNAGATLVYYRKDATSQDAAIYVTVNGGTAWAPFQTSGAGGSQADLIFDAATELTIATGAITATQGAHTIDTEADAASDDLDTIAGGTAEEVIVVRANNAARTVVLKHAIGANRIACVGGRDISLAEANDAAILFYNGTQWVAFGSTLLDNILGTANAWTAAQTFSHATGVTTDTVTERSAGAGVTLDGVLLKDSHIVDSVGFYDGAAPTKIVRLDAGAVTAGNTRVLAMPDADVTVSAFAATFLDDANEATLKATLNMEAGVDFQAYDADLDAVAGLAVAGLIARTGAGTAAARTLTAPAAGITVSNGDGAAGNPTLALANDLAAYEGLATTGLVARTGDGTATTRAITAPAAGISIANGDGVAGAPTLSLANDLSAVEGLAGTGLAVRTGADAWTNRSVAVGSASLTVVNGDGVAGNPTLDTAQSIQTSASPSFAGLTSTGAITTTDGVAGGTARKVGGKAFGTVADATAVDPAGAGDAPEAVISTYTIPANTIKASTKVRVDFAYVMTTGATVETLVMRLRLGGVAGTIVAASTSVDPGTGSGSGYAILVGHAAPGAAAEIAHFGVIKDFAAAGADSTVVQQGPTLTNFATNGALDLVLTADFGAAEAAGGDTVAVRIFEVEVSG